MTVTKLRPAMSVAKSIDHPPVDYLPLRRFLERLRDEFATTEFQELTGQAVEQLEAHPELLRLAARYGVRYMLGELDRKRTVVHRREHGAGSPKSAKWGGVAKVHRESDVFAEIVCVSRSGERKPLRDCSAADLRVAESLREDAAMGLIQEADRFSRLRKALTSSGADVVGDLGRDEVEGIFYA